MENLGGQETESRLKLEHTIAELSTQTELAELDRGIAEDELAAMLVEVQRGDAGGRQMTPKDEQNARFQERMRYLAVLDATLDLRKADLSLLRQTVPAKAARAWKSSMGVMRPLVETEVVRSW